MGTRERHIYVSPHFDDAVLSCGGRICLHRERGEPVTVLTLCAGPPPPGGLSPLAHAYHAAWLESGPGAERRREENAAVLSRIGADGRECPTPDAIYRGDGSGPFYGDRRDLFGEPDARDAASVVPAWEAAVRRVAEEAGTAVVHFPLAIGGHVDHELARRVGERIGDRGPGVAFYEDYPYVELEPDGVQTAQAKFGARLWRRETVRIDVEAKIEAARGYRTQVGPVFGCEADLDRRIRDFSAATACEIDARERLRRLLAPSGRRRSLWRRALGWHAHAERIWRCEAAPAGGGGRR